MNQYTKLSWLFVMTLFLMTAFVACDKDDDDHDHDDHDHDKTLVSIPADADEATIQTAFLSAEAGQTIEFAAGTYNLTQTLSIDGVDNLKIKGAGLEETVLNFDNQAVGAEGIKITNSNMLVIANLTVEETAGDAIKTQDCDGIAFLNVGVIWSEDASSTNGAYGLYPVMCTNILIEGCVARGASDAGIYVGQSDKVIVRNNLAEKNVAGIEIENTANADVYDNVSMNNTGGILIFDLPGLSRYGGYCRVFNNKIENNNFTNFAPSGMVSEVPEGSGMIILSTQNVEVFDNEFTENNLMGIGIVNYRIFGELGEKYEINDENYDPNPGNIYILDNTFTRSGADAPVSATTFGGLLRLMFLGSTFPDIMWDGIDPGSDGEKEYPICIQNNGEIKFEDVDVWNFDPLKPELRNPSNDLAPHDCTRDRLPEIEVTVPTL